MWRTCQATLLSAVNANRDVRFRAVVIVNVMTPCHGSKVREKQPEVVVIGAGIAGLTAAALLAKNGARVRRWCDVGQWFWAARCSPAARRAVGIERPAAARIRPRGRTVLARAGADPAGAFMVYALVRDVVPGAWERADVTDCATPHTFAAFTMDARGLVGGLPQTPANANLRALASQRDRWGSRSAATAFFRVKARSERPLFHRADALEHSRPAACPR
jgi:NAD(P)-binding Rossmann-like domain